MDSLEGSAFDPDYHMWLRNADRGDVLYILTIKRSFEIRSS